MATNRHNEPTVKTCIHAGIVVVVVAVLVVVDKSINAADPDVSGLSAMSNAHTTFLSQVMGFKCLVYQKVDMSPHTMDNRVGAPGTNATHSNAAA